MNTDGFYIKLHGRADLWSLSKSMMVLMLSSESPERGLNSSPERKRKCTAENNLPPRLDKDR